MGITPWGGVIGYGNTKEEALHTAAGLASDLAAVLKEHPMLATVLPPGLPIALKGVSVASEALSKGKAVEDVAKAIGPATASLASKLLSLF